MIRTFADVLTQDVRCALTPVMRTDTAWSRYVAGVTNEDGTQQTSRGRDTGSQLTAPTSFLATTQANGTGWTGGDNVPYYPGTSSYIMQDLFNWRLYQEGGTGYEWYTSVVVPKNPSSSQTSTYKTDLVYDITSYFPEALNQFAVGYNNNLPWQGLGAWQHWMSARGYASSGAQTIVNDPGWTAGNDATVTSVGVQGTITYMFGGHGYAW